MLKSGLKMPIHTFREELHKPTFRLVALFGTTLVIVFTITLISKSYMEDAFNMGIFLVDFMAFAFTIFFMSDRFCKYIGKDEIGKFENNKKSNMLYIFTRYKGLLLICLTVFLSMLIAHIFVLKMNYMTPDLFYIKIAITSVFKMVVAGAIAVFFSFLTKEPMLASLSTMMLWYFGYLVTKFYIGIKIYPDTILAPISKVLSYILPNVENVATFQPGVGRLILVLFFYSLIYMVLFLMFSSMIASRKKK